MRRAARPTKTHLTIKLAHRQFPHPDQLAGAARQNDAGARRNGHAGKTQPLAGQFQGFFDARGDDALQQRARRDHGTSPRLVSARRRLDHVAIFVGRGDRRAVQGLDSLGPGQGGGKAARNIRGHVLTADGQTVHMDKRALGKDRHRRRAAAHIDADGAKVHLVLFEGRKARGEGRRHDPFERQVRQIGAVTQGGEGGFSHRDDQKLQRQLPPVQMARVLDGALAINRPGDGQEVDDAPTRRARLGQSQLDAARQIMIADRPRAQRHRRLDAVAGHIAARRGQDDA